MSPARSVWPGVFIGLVLGVAILLALERGRTPPPRWPEAGPLLSDCDGRMTELVIQYLSPSADICAPAYRAFLPLLPADVTVRVACPAQADFDDLLKRIGPVSCRMLPIFTGHAMTCWSRDRWLALTPLERGGPATLLYPTSESAQEAWPARRGDARVAEEIAASTPKRSVAFRSRLLFDGGDFVCDSETAFVNPAVIQRNIPSMVRDEKELTEELARLLKRRIILLRDAPAHHTEMFMTLLPGKRAVVGDPAEGLRLAKNHPAASALLAGAGGADESAETQRMFDSVAQECLAAGYRVTRLPVLPGLDSRTWLSYGNVVIDNRDGRTLVYMPVYRGAEELNDAAEKLWRECGATVRPVDCTSTYTRFGSLHCLVSIMGRE